MNMVYLACIGGYKYNKVHVHCALASRVLNV